MTVPIDYRQAGPEFDRFMLDLRDALDMQTTHQAWGALLGVFEIFRRRLTAEHVLIFAHALPPLMRACFVENWRRGEGVRDFAPQQELDREVMAYHRDHQLAGPGCIAATAQVVRRHVDSRRLDAALDALPDGARSFWCSGED